MNAPAANSAPADHVVRRMLGADEIIDFVTGGKATFTIKNTQTGNRATYRVDAEGDDRHYVVSVFTGSNNEDRKYNYTVLGVMDSEGVWRPRTALSPVEEIRAAAIKEGRKQDSWVLKFLDSIGSRIANGGALTRRQQKFFDRERRRYKVGKHVSDPVKRHAFPWLWWRLVDRGLDLPASIEVWHEGRCCHCRKKLTVPASVMLNLGPNCASSIGRWDEWKALNEKLGDDLEIFQQSIANKMAA